MIARHDKRTRPGTTPIIATEFRFLLVGILDDFVLSRPQIRTSSEFLRISYLSVAKMFSFVGQRPGSVTMVMGLPVPVFVGALVSCSEEVLYCLSYSGLWWTPPLLNCP